MLLFITLLLLCSVYVDSSSDSSSDDNILDYDIGFGRGRDQAARSVRRRLNNEDGGAPANNGRRRTQFGGFVRRNSARENEVHPDRVRELEGILQLASAHPGGIGGSLGHGNRSQWVTSNIGAFFDPNGPLGRYTQVNVDTLMRHLRTAQEVARSIYTRDHSNDRTGADHEDVPNWARLFFGLFDQQSQASRNVQAVAARVQRRAVSSSITGRQAPLGQQDTSRPAELRHETSPNDGPRAMRQRVIAGNVREEREQLVEGRDDTANRRPAPVSNIQNGTVRRNVHIGGGGGGFDPSRNDPMSRFASLEGGYASLNALTDAVTQSLAVPPINRTTLQIAREYHEVTGFVAGASNESDQAFYNLALGNLRSDMLDAVRQRDGDNGNGNGNSNGSNE